MVWSTAYHRYLWYILRHKWYVTKECWKEGLYWQGLIHDWSKFLPDEFLAYARHFHGPQAKDNLKKETGKTGYKKPVQSGDSDFDTAWLKHTRRNPHHPEYWVMGKAEESVPFSMPEKYVREMLCDWRGAGKAQNNPTSTKDWYLANKEKLIFHPSTEDLVENLLGVFKAVIGVAGHDARSDEIVTVVTAQGPSTRVEVDIRVATGFKVRKDDVLCLHEDGSVRPLVSHKHSLYQRFNVKARKLLGIFDDFYLTETFNKREICNER